MQGMYANQTSVSVEKSRAEIETVLAKYGADHFAYATQPCFARIGFAIEDPQSKARLMVKMTLPLPAKNERRFTHTADKGLPRRSDQILQSWEQACRSSWRALLLVIKAKLEACAAGISTVEREFMADVVTGDGRTIGEIVGPQMTALGKGAGLKLLN